MYGFTTKYGCIKRLRSIASLSIAWLHLPSKTQSLSFPWPCQATACNSIFNIKVAFSKEGINHIILYLLPTSLTEIQNARGVMDVLSEMLNAIDPGNREVIFLYIAVHIMFRKVLQRKKIHSISSVGSFW